MRFKHGFTFVMCSHGFQAKTGARDHGRQVVDIVGRDEVMMFSRVIKGMTKWTVAEKKKEKNVSLRLA